MIEVYNSEVLNSDGEPATRYWLAEDPTISVTTTKANGLNKLCRKLVKLGMDGPAMVAWPDGKSSVAIRDIAKVAARDLREGSLRGFYEAGYRARSGASQGQPGGYLGSSPPSPSLRSGRPSPIPLTLTPL